MTTRAAAVIAAAVLAAGCAPAHTTPPPPDLGPWATIVAPVGFTASHVGACHQADTVTVAELVRRFNAEHRSYGSEPQAGDTYYVPASTVDCLEGVTL